MQYVLLITHNSNVVLPACWKAGQSHVLLIPHVEEKKKQKTNKQTEPPNFQSDKGIPVLSLHMKDLTAILSWDHSRRCV